MQSPLLTIKHRNHPFEQIVLSEASCSLVSSIRFTKAYIHFLTSFCPGGPPMTRVHVEPPLAN